MRVAETEETGGLAVKQGGEATFAQAAGYAAKSGEFSTPYLDNMEARFEKQNRISVRALRALEPGDAYVTFRDTVVKIKTFFANPEGEYGSTLDELERQVNHFLAFAKPTKEDVKKTGVLVEVAERLADSHFAKIVEQRAKDERAAIVKLANEKTDPTRLRNEISAGSVAFLRAAYGGGKKATPTDLITAGAASIAAIMQAMQKQGDKFARDVRAWKACRTIWPVRAGSARPRRCRAWSTRPRWPLWPPCGLCAPHKAPRSPTPPAGPRSLSPRYRRRWRRCAQGRRQPRPAMPSWRRRSTTPRPSRMTITSRTRLRALPRRWTPSARRKPAARPPPRRRRRA
jgi:hypothetical protein